MSPSAGGSGQIGRHSLMAGRPRHTHSRSIDNSFVGNHLRQNGSVSRQNSSDSRQNGGQVSRQNSSGSRQNSSDSRQNDGQVSRQNGGEARNGGGDDEIVDSREVKSDSVEAATRRLNLQSKDYENYLFHNSLNIS
eukprot:TRINITY_DN24010_c0_g1_i1.p1 TRINITY_DN24010_c0_g1~~TRINITY_DN24010_c0_g1_i1.p1  ORF type:complete len:146 (+),score=40.01 TRINITY_DN24010_c0_g1_i1:32-439(+)